MEVALVILLLILRVDISLHQHVFLNQFYEIKISITDM